MNSLKLRASIVLVVLGLVLSACQGLPSGRFSQRPQSTTPAAPQNGQPNFRQRAPQGQQSAPGGNQPTPPVIEPNFGDDQPAPAAPQGDQPSLPRLAPQGDQPAPRGNQPTPPVIEPNFGNDQPAPAAPQGNQPALPRLAPQGDQPAPQGQQPAPRGNQPTPPVIEPNFGDNQPAPAAPQQTAPQDNQPAPQPVQPSPDALESIPGVTVSGNTITASFTEQQLTDLLSKFLAANPQLPLQNPQVHLQNNQVEIDGYLSQGFFSGDVKIVMTLSIDADGVIRPKVVSGSLGGFNLPASVLDSIQTQIDDGITQFLNSGNNLYKAESITIENGKITVTGSHK